MAELADALDLGSNGEILAGSTPVAPTILEPETGIEERWGAAIHAENAKRLTQQTFLQLLKKLRFELLFYCCEAERFL